MKKWLVKQANPDLINTLMAETGLSAIISTVAVARGIDCKTKTDEFFLDIDLSDPFLLKDMDKAVEIIDEHLQNGDKITIFGDYDCDGVTSTVILYQYLTTLGGEIDWYIPDRSEGYGMNADAVRKLHENGTALIVTVDNGISAADEIALAKDLGMRVVITDHHQAPDTLPPADAIIDPHRPDDHSPFKQLAGCGVALKLAAAIEGDTEAVLEQFAELAAIGTVADIVPLVGENRTIVKRGLENLQNTDNVGLYKLMVNCKIDDSRLSSTSLAFSLSPRINAAGRFSHAGKAVELLLSENDELASAKAQQLSELNHARQQEEMRILAEAERFIDDHPATLAERVLIVSGEDWHHGVVGIVSSRLLTRFDKPCMVISIEGEFARGSARSIEGFSLYSLLCGCSELLVKYGGHARAAGFTLRTEDLGKFTAAVSAWAREHYPIMPNAVVEIDKSLSSDDLSVKSVEQLSLLEPCGEGNPSPVFLMKDCKIVGKKPLKEGKYLSLTVQFAGKQQKILCFSMRYSDFWYNIGDTVDLLVTLSLSEYNDNISVSAIMKDVRRSDFAEDRYFAAQRTYEKLQCGEPIDNRLYKRIIPSIDDIKIVYDLIKVHGNFHALIDNSALKGLNYCMVSVILDVLTEFQLIDYKPSSGQIALLPTKGKSDLTKSVHIARLKANLL